MFGNANDSRLLAEKRRKYQNFNDLLISIKFDINDCANFGLNETTYKVEQNYLEFIDIVIQQL